MKDRYDDNFSIEDFKPRFEKIVESVKQHVEDSRLDPPLLGKTKVFMKHHMVSLQTCPPALLSLKHSILEMALIESLRTFATAIQKHWRGYCVRQWFLRFKQQVGLIQAGLLSCLALSFYMGLIEVVAYRCTSTRNSFLEFVEAACAVQRSYRSFNPRFSFKTLKSTALDIQKGTAH